jgi:predicted nucleic acid-binding protein
VDRILRRDRERVREWVQKPDTTLVITGLIVSEVCNKFLKDGQDAENAMQMLRDLTILEPYDYELGLESARLYTKERKKRQKFGLADAHALAASRRRHARLITCDNDFAGFADVILIN